MAVRPIQSRLLGGRSTPAMRAMLFLPASLTLALAVLRVRTDHAHYSAPMNHFALHANFLYRCSYLHFDSVLPALRLLVAVDNPPARQIVGRKLHCHAVTRKNADEILPHLS